MKKEQIQQVIQPPEESEYLNCIRCGLCLAVCPTYREYKNEIASPRGRIALARMGLESDLELSSNLFEQMYACFDCLACEQICPVGINPARLILEMRSLQEQRNPSGWKKWLFGRLLSHPSRLELATLPLRLYEFLGLRKLVYWLGLRKWMPSQLRDLEGMLPHLPQRPLRQTLPEKSPAMGEKKYRVGFFLGCAQSLMFSEESQAVVRVLNRNGCEVITPKNAVCCGMPAAGYGRMDLVMEQAKTNIRIFNDMEVDVIVTDCATCGATLKDYHLLLKEDPDWASRAEAFSQKVRDISEYLSSIPLEKPMGRLDLKVTYHDPCHLRRAQGVWNQPRELMKLVDGVEFTELPEADWCCGSAGSQLITHYETSTRVMDRKINHLQATGADFVASGCPGCQMQLSSGIKRHGMKTQVIHPIQILDLAYRKGEKEL